MKLIALIGRIPGRVETVGDCEATEIRALCTDSRRVAPGALFFCTPGLRMDAHDFAPQAIEKGAAALVVQRRLDVDVPQVIVDDVRIATSYIASAFYGHPAERMMMLGITGTKGKTTTSYLVKSVMDAAGYKTGLIGTVGSMIGDESIPSRLTTPDPVETQQILARMADAGVQCVVMEVSAHAAAMHRLAGVKFRVGAFSNFSQDHLDFFRDMDEYFDAKMKLFEPGICESMVYNADDERVAGAMRALDRPALRIGIREPSDVYANDIEVGERGCSFLMTWHKQFRTSISLRLAGIFNVYNALLAAGIGICAGVGPEAIRRGLENVRAVPGRIELLDTGTPYRVILDYAHSPDALENVLAAVRDTTRGRLIALFGCGGARDHSKRPLMGEIAGRLADYCIITSDNPRNENPMDIIDAIEEGIRLTGCAYTVIENRREAIRYALQFAQKDDVVVLAGKGHETYQEIHGVKYPFDEKVIVSEILTETKGHIPLKR